MSLIPGYTRADDSTIPGAPAVNVGIRGNRAYYGPEAGVRSVTMNPYTAREFGYGAVATTQGAGNGAGPIGGNAEPGNAADDAAVAASTDACWGFDGNDANTLEGFV